MLAAERGLGAVVPADPLLARSILPQRTINEVFLVERQHNQRRHDVRKPRTLALPISVIDQRFNLPPRIIECSLSPGKIYGVLKR